MSKLFEFNPENIKKVDITEVSINDWNPKDDNTPEYEEIKRSIELNGYAQPILTRKVGDKYQIVDGQNRYLAACELGYQEIYIYDAGEIPEDEAKAMTLWMQTQVPFVKSQLEPLVLKLTEKNIDLPRPLVVEATKPIEIKTPEKTKKIDQDQLANATARLIYAYCSDNSELFYDTAKVVCHIFHAGGKEDLENQILSFLEES